jgi:hypothetical protein
MKANVTNIKLIIAALLFCVSIHASSRGDGAAQESTQVAIEKIPTLNQWIHENNCGLHALNNARLGLELLNAKNEKEANNIRKNIKDKKSFYQFTYTLGFNENATNSIKGLDELEMASLIEKLGATDDILIIIAEIINPNSEYTIGLFSRLLNQLQNLSGETYRKGFVITNGGQHWIACAIEKVDGTVTRILSMNSARYASDSNPVAHWLKKIVAPSYVGLTDEEAINRIVDIANDHSLSEKIELYDKYQRCLKIAKCIVNSFSKSGSFHEYTMAQYEINKILSQSLIDDFTQTFADLVKEIGMQNIYLSEKKNEKNETIYLSKFEFLQMFLPDSLWWTDPSFFTGDDAPTINFTPEQQAEMIELMNIESLLPEAEIEFNEQLTYQRCLKIAESIQASFYNKSFAHEYVLTKYKKDTPIKDLIDSFTTGFREYVQSIPESGTDRPSFIKKRNEREGLIYLSKVDFLKMFLLDSQWWTDASLFRNENGPFNFTLEERKQMIELMNIQRLLEDA